MLRRRNLAGSVGFQPAGGEGPKSPLATKLRALQARLPSARLPSLSSWPRHPRQALLQGVVAEALLSGRLDAVSWFQKGSYLPAMIFSGDPAPPTPPPPPTREVT